jgi:peptidyl-prolyl cis-trans isomerase D
MLRGIRKASENWLGRAVMAVVMTLLAGSFAVWGINDIFRGFGNSTLAKIGGVEIPIEQFRQSYQDRLEQVSRQLGHPLPPDQATALGLDHQVLAEMIAQAGLDQRAHQMGLGLADSEIAANIAADPNLQTVNGQFDRARFDEVLHSMGLTEQRFIADQRQTALRRQIIDSVSGGIVPPKAWFDAINQYRDEQRSVEFVALGAAQAGDIPQATDDQLEKYFDARKTLFRAPEYRKIDTVTATPAELAKWMEISDDDLKKAYDARRASFTTPERRHIEQIVFPAMADAQAAADRIKSGTSFAAIAAERGLKDQDIDLGTVAKSAIVDPAVGDAAFSLKQGEVSAPMQGRFGAVLVTVLAIDPEVTKSLADVTPQLRNDLALERAKPQVQDIHDKIEDDRAGGMTLEQAAAKEKLAMVTYDAVSRNGLDPDGKPVVNLPHGAEVVNAAFASDVGVDNDPIDADGGYVWFDVAGITPAHDRALDEVKPQVEQQWRANETASRLRSKANDLLDKLKTGTPFDTLAASNGLKIETANDFNRRGAVPGMSPKTIDAVFHTAKDAFGSGEGNDPTQWIVFRVTGVKTPALDPNSTEGKDLQQTVQRQLGDDVIGQYVARLENDLGTNVNAAVLAQAMGQNNAPDTN